MTAVDLAVDSFVASSTGPILCEDLAPGGGVVVVDRDGRFSAGVVEDVEHLGDREVAQLLTSVGDIKVPLASAIITKRGSERLSELAHVDPGATRIELVRPADLPQAQGRPCTTKNDILCAIGAVEPPVVMIPAVRSDLECVVGTIEAYLQRSGSEYEVVESDRWTTFVFAPGAWTHPGDLRAQADVLAALTAWTDERGLLRTRMCDERLRRRLLASLVACGKAPAVQWVPGYRPAECHVSERTDWKPFSPLNSIRVCAEPAIRVQLSRIGRLVCGLAVVGPGV